MTFIKPGMGVIRGKQSDVLRYPAVWLDPGVTGLPTLLTPQRCYQSANDVISGLWQAPCPQSPVDPQQHIISSSNCVGLLYSSWSKVPSKYIRSFC